MTQIRSKQILADLHAACLGAAKAGFARVGHLCAVRTRYVLTRDNRLRLRYVASGGAGLALVAGLYAGGLINPQAVPLALAPATVQQMAALEPAAGVQPTRVVALAGQAVKQSGEVLLAAHRDLSGQVRRNPQTIQTAALINEDLEREDNIADGRVATSGLRQLRVQVDKGDTLAGVLQDAGVNTNDALTVVDAVAKHVNPRAIKAGQSLDLSLSPDQDNAALQFTKASFVIDPLRTLYIERNGQGDIRSRLDQKAVKPVREARKVMIEGSLYGSADRAGLPDNVTANAIRLFSYAVDFQRDVRQGDSLEVMYDTLRTEDGFVAKTGDIVYARMSLGGKEYTLYRYGDKGAVDYYTPDGKSIRKATGLMKTPVAFGRMTSGFGARVHPVLGYTKMHKGVDFGAPVGTAVYAAADGTIEKASRFSSYGNYVKIKHSAKLATAYAHLSRYASGIRPGVKVKQGQIIAYVGTTGRSTGPHLHFEVMANNVQINPTSVKMAVDSTLQGNELKRFRDQVRRFGLEYAEAMGDRVKLASQ